MNFLAHKPPFSLHVQRSYFVAYARLFNMSHDPTLRFAPPPCLSKNTATQIRRARTSNLRHDCSLSGSPSHTLLFTPSIAVTSPDRSNDNFIHSNPLNHLPLERYRQTAFRCDSEYVPAFAMSPYHITDTDSCELPVWKLQSLGPFGVGPHSEETRLSKGSLVRLFDEELNQYTLGFEKHILRGWLVKAMRREPGIQIYQMAVDRFTVTAAQIAIEQQTAYVAIPYYFISATDLIAEISPNSLGQEVGLGGEVIFPVRKWTHPPKAEQDWSSQQERREKRM